MFFYDLHTHFYLFCSILLTAFTLYKLKNLRKSNSSLFLSSLAILIYLFRSFNALAYSLAPYKSYYLYLAAFVYTIQSIMLLAAVEFITSKFSKGQDSKGNFTTRRDLAEFKEYLWRDKKSLGLLVIWNLIFYGILWLAETLYHPHIARFGNIFLVTSYWVAAHHLNVLSLDPEMTNNEEVKRKLDVIVTMMTMMGFMNLVLTLFQPLVAKYMIGIQASLYIFEVIATAFTADLFNGKPKVVTGFLQYSSIVEKI